MGMFDYINVDKKWLPKQLHTKELSFQTKSLECLLHTYDIDETGQLYLSVRSESDGEAIGKQDYTGEIQFYDYPDRNWVEFKAWCVNGIVKEVIEVK